MAVDGGEKCIYCKSEGSSHEHVAPSSLGGNCILGCVCTTCNTEMSLIDQALAEHSPVAFSKILHTPPAAFITHLGGHATLQAQGGREFGVRIGNQMTTEVRPQLFANGNHIQAVASDGDGLNDLIRFIDKQIEKGRLATTRVVITEEAKEPRFLMHRSDEAVVSCSSPKRAAQFLRRLEKKWTEIRTKLEASEEERRTHAQPEIVIKMAFWPNEEYRGVAKIAFETLALLRGAAFVLQGAFDPVREYIKGDVRLPDPKPGEVPVDTRFVERLGDEFKLKFSDQHGVLLVSSPPALLAVVILYGTHPYLIRLATLDGELRWMRGYEFSYTRAGHRELDEVAVCRQILELCPEVFGISRDEAREELKHFETSL
jgi:hypothetical protein